ncbi:multiple sugar transport system ATP-binding protein [Rhizobium sp. BK313]|uniref:ABC transporter ATP-binding protein n=1 Tax=Rhizobium sp. BK313 TaxID=2587081 RepID=UPI00160E0F52|nr:ABC transporter ATP-binding protein [Rhizobium sp. BK313]MBB3458806.1 multiple sugar transport system ATP-binding protein [Rhizobium sp. BK313]
MASIAFTHIAKSFGNTPILRDLSFSVASGEFLTILGPSGCGKSTLLRIVAGLERQDSGTVAVDGKIVDGLAPKARDIAMVFQSYALYPHMTVAENMALPLTMRRLSALQRLPLLGRLMPATRQIGAGIRADVARLAGALAIADLLQRKPGQLSGGQRQRVALGRAMVRQPAIFLMDEPLSNLDAELRVQMRAEIKELHRQLGATFIYVTHDQSEAMTLSDRVAVMAGGELLQVASPRQIYEDPIDRRVAEFVGAPKINLIEAIVAEDGAIALAGTPLSVRAKADPGTAVTLGLRPEHLALCNEPGRDVVAVRVRLLEHMGSDVFVHAQAQASVAPFIARLAASHATDIAIGQTILLKIDAARLLLFGGDGRRMDTDIAQGTTAASGRAKESA